MKSSNMTVTSVAVGERRSPKPSRVKPVDIMVVALGMTVTLAGYFSREISWVLVGA